MGILLKAPHASTKPPPIVRRGLSRAVRWLADSRYIPRLIARVTIRRFSRWPNLPFVTKVLLMLNQSAAGVPGKHEPACCVMQQAVSRASDVQCARCTPQPEPVTVTDCGAQRS